MTTPAIIETTGNGRRVLGVWLAGADNGDPEALFVDEIDQLMAERILSEAVGVAPWVEFMEHLHTRQNHITTQRAWLDDWPGTAAELLAAAQAQVAAGKPLVDLAP